jgi:hypothetical protein
LFGVLTFKRKIEPYEDALTLQALKRSVITERLITSS